VRQHCKQSLTGYKVPRLVVFKDDLPKSNVGKVLRKDLRDEAQAGLPEATSRACLAEAAVGREGRMDNLCHSLVGMALSRAGLHKRTCARDEHARHRQQPPGHRRRRVRDRTLAMSFRRGWTHGVLAQLTLPIALTGAMLLYDRYRNKSSPTERVVPSQILLLSYLGVLLHVFMDFTNSYGVRLLMPFSEEWFYGDALYIVDPWLYLTLGLGWWLGKTNREPRASAWRSPRSTCWRCSLERVARREVAAAWRARDVRRHALHGDAGRRQSVPARSGDRCRRSLREGQSLVRSAAAFPAGGFGIEKGSTIRRAAGCSCRGRALSSLVALPVRAIDPAGARSG
jgi:hypothetical protein